MVKQTRFILVLSVIVIAATACAPKRIKTLEPAIQPIKEVKEALIEGTRSLAGIFDSSLLITPRSANINESALAVVAPEPPKPSWTIFEKIKEAKVMLESAELFVGDKGITYYENIINRDENGKISFSRRKITEEEKEIALALLNTETGKITIIKVKRNGEKLIVPPEYMVEIVQRASGIKWNYWNTHYKVTAPERTIVIGNTYPNAKTVTSIKKVNVGKGKYANRTVTNRVVDPVYYVPYSKDLHQSFIVQAGKEYNKSVVNEAYKALTSNKVKSRAFPDKLVTEVFSASRSYFERIPLIEQSDLGEFILDPITTAERVFVILGTNTENAFSKTCNSSSACGMYQFIPSTYNNIRKAYKPANLIIDTMEGRKNHINAAQSAILLYDYNLGDLVKRFGEKIIYDPKLEEYLAAAYNGSPRHVHNSLTATLGRNVAQWTTHLKKETLGFMVKLRFLRDNNINN